ncbi:MAG: MFS transporter, partial [Methylobacteriaceae bacterium]|nr:MFS transporter [Methylobacteriaceae bacterium]
MAAIVYDCLRCRQSAAWQMDGESSRELVLGMLKVQRALAVETVERLFSGDKYASAPLTGAERALYVRDFPDGAPLHIAGDFPEWATDRLLRVFGESVTAEMHAMAKKAPLDMRVNKLAGTREEALNELQHYCPLPTPCSPLGVRILPAEDAKAPPIQSEPAYLSGLVEIQDEGSQLVTLLVGAG